MRTTFLTAAALFGLMLAPALAGEGNGDPFPAHFGNLTATTQTLPQVADTGSDAYPNVSGRPGSDLPSLLAEVLPTNGSEGAVQTANSLPVGAEEGTVAYAQARSVQAWMLAHSGRSAPVFAAMSPR